MKRILFVNNFALGGGVESVMKTIIFNLPKNEFEITIFNFLKDNKFSEVYDSSVNYIYEFDIEKKMWRELGRNVISDIINAREKEIIEKLDSKDFDIVVAMQEGMPAKYVSKLKCKNKIAWIHINYQFSEHTRAVFSPKEELECMKKFNKVVCVSEATKKIFIEKIGDSGNLCVRYNPINIYGLIEKSKESIDFEMPNDRLNFITLGRLDKQKGYDRLIESANKLLEEGKKFNLYIIGEGEKAYSEYLKNKVKFKENICFLGGKINPFPYLIKADCYVCASIWEAHSMSIQEAIILKMPIVMTNYLGAEEAFENGKAGIIVEDSEKGIYNGMLEILNHKEKLKEYKKYLEQSNYAEIEKRMENIIQLFKNE